MLLHTAEDLISLLETTEIYFGSTKIEFYATEGPQLLPAVKALFLKSASAAFLNLPQLDLTCLFGVCFDQLAGLIFDMSISLGCIMKIHANLSMAFNLPILNVLKN